MIDRSFKFHPGPVRGGDSEPQRSSRRHSGLYKEGEKSPKEQCRLTFKEFAIH